MQTPNPPNPRPRATTPQAPAPPAPPPPPDLPRTPEELEALVNKRLELKLQLESVSDRREDLAEQLEDADPAARTGLEERIKILDDRSGRLEREILLADDAIAAGMASGLGKPEQEGPTTVQVLTDEGISKDVVANLMLGEALAFVLLGVVFYRWMMKRAREGFGRASPEDARRMEQLQNSVDAIAIEVERVSENQRYVTKALNEGLQPEAAAKAREESFVPRKGT